LCKYVQGRGTVDVQCFWSKLQISLDFSQPFSDFIHQIEADRPAIGHCNEGLTVLDDHGRKSMDLWREQPNLCSERDVKLGTWGRRLNGSGNVQCLLQPAHVAAFLIDPL
jgi:hypothetical protein